MVLTVPVSNRLIAALPRATRDVLLGAGEPFALVFGATLCEPGKPLRHAYFPLSGFISEVMPIAGHPPLEMNLIGAEGMLGATLALGVNASALRGVVQGAGLALRLSAPSLREQVAASAALSHALERYVFLTMVQFARTAACTHFHPIEARLARWLLMSNDRAPGATLHLTHGFLAHMLGVQRSAVTIAAGALQHQDVISYSRGEIRVLDRPGLEAASCVCYVASLDEHSRLMR